MLKVDSYYHFSEQTAAIALLRQTAPELELAWGIRLERYEEDGLGAAIGGVVVTEDGLALLLRELLQGIHRGVSIEVARSAASEETLENVLRGLGVSEQDCYWTMKEGYEPIPHRVCREDDNGVRFEVGEFPSRIEALLKIEELAKGGHKQCYWTEVS